MNEVVICTSVAHVLGSHSRQPNTEEKTIDYVFKLLDIPWWYYAIVALFCAVSWRTWKKPSLGLLVGYSVLILVETVLIRKPFVGQHFQPKPFWSWRVWAVQKEQILTNVIMFVPVGILAGRLWKWRGLWAAAGLSIFIEILQLITARGLCEFDDVIHNCVGAAVGIGIVMMARRLMSGQEGDVVEPE